MSQVSVWFADDDYKRLERAAAATTLTASGYVGRFVVERWLRARRNRLAKALQPAQPAIREVAT